MFVELIVYIQHIFYIYVTKNYVSLQELLSLTAEISGPSHKTNWVGSVKHKVGRTKIILLMLGENFFSLSLAKKKGCCYYN